MICCIPYNINLFIFKGIPLASLISQFTIVSVLHFVKDLESIENDDDI